MTTYIPDLSVTPLPGMFTNPREEKATRNMRTLEMERSIFANAEQISDYSLTGVENMETPYKDVLKGIQELNPFSKAFFSRQNINFIQSAIRYGVYIQSDKKRVIDNQDETILVVIMRGIYLEKSYRPQSPEEFKREIIELNKIVVDTVVPKIIIQLDAYTDYLTRLNGIQNPLEYGKNMSNVGLKGDSSRGPSDVWGLNTNN